MYDKNVTAPIGAQIRRLRNSLGLTLAEVAGRAGTSAPSLHRYESGWDRFRLSTLRRIAGSLGADVEVRLVVREPALREPDGPVLPPGTLLRLIRPLFWDTDLEASDLERYPGWVLERVLVFGGRDQVEAVRRFYGDRALVECLDRPGVNRRTRAYWRLVLEDQCTPGC